MRQAEIENCGDTTTATEVMDEIYQVLFQKKETVRVDFPNLEYIVGMSDNEFSKMLTMTGVVKEYIDKFI